MKRDQEVVQSYLDDLLSEQPAAVITLAPAVAHAAPPLSTPVQEPEHSLEVVQRQQLQALLDRPAPLEVKQCVPHSTLTPTPTPTPLPVTPKPVAPVAAPVVEEAVVLEESEPAPVSPLLQWCDNGRPLWAQQDFDVLLFRVAGLTLAVPLIALGQIHPLTDGLTPIFGQADWFMGLQPTPAGRIRTVNTALFVMPERYDPAFIQSARYVVSIDGLDWGLAVDQVQQPTRLNPDDVTWRSTRGKRAWLAGTVKTAMCALLDVPQMGRILQSHDRLRVGVASG
jgi:purine-binding chemotaxis protein CheW